jgi:RNA polymerase sigma factor (sigma-70 family)
MAAAHSERLVHYVRQLATDATAGKSDSDLLQSYLVGGDQSAFAALVRRHGAMVFGVCRAVLRQRQDAEDAFQAAFLVLARKAGSIRRPEGLAGWLQRVAYRLALRARAASVRRHVRETRAVRSTDTQPSCDELSWGELRTLLHEELAALPGCFREPLVLCYLEGLTQEEAARRLGCTAATIKGRVERGREKLRRRLERRGVTLTAALAAALAGQAITAPVVSAAMAAAVVRATQQFAAGTLSTTAATLARGFLRGALTINLTIKWTLSVVLLAIVMAAGKIAPLSPQPNPDLPHGVAAEKPVPPPAAPRTDLYGDPLPPGAVARLGTLRFRDPNCPFSLAFSADGKLVASGTGHRAGLIRILDAKTGKQLVLLRGDDEQIYFVGFSPSGKRLFSTGLATGLAKGTGIAIRCWDVVAGKELRRIADRAGHATALSKDGKRLVNTGDDGVRLWDADSGKQLLQFGREADSRGGLAFSNDGKLLAGTCRDGSIALWDAETGREVRRLAGHGVPPSRDTRVSSLAFSPDDRSLASGARGSLFLWDTTSGKERFHMAPPKETVIRGATRDGPNIVCFSPEGSRLAVGYGGVVLDTTTGKERVRLEDHPRWVRCQCFSPDGKYLVADDNVGLRFWDAVTGKVVAKDSAHRDPVCSLAFFPDGKTLATTSWDRTVHRWEIATGKELSQFRGQGQRAVEHNEVAVAPDGRVLAAWLGGTLYRWDVRDPKAVEEIHAPQQPRSRWQRAVAFTPRAGMRALAQSWDGKECWVWRDDTRQKPRLFAGERFDGNRFAFFPDGKRVVLGGSGGRARVWDMDTGKIAQVLEGFHEPNGDGISAMRMAVFAMALSSDGGILALGSSGGMVALWDPASGKELFRLNESRHGVFANALAFSPSGKTLAAGYEDGLIRLSELSGGGLRRQWRGHAGSIECLAFSPCGRFLASGSRDTTVLIWDVLRASIGAEDAGETNHSTPPALEVLWTDLAARDAAKAYRGIAILALSPERSVPFLAPRLQPARAPESDRLTRLITDLDSRQFAIRAKAAQELEQLAELAEPALRKLLAAKPSLEARRRAEGLLEKLHGPVLVPEQLRALRVVEVLEHAGTRAARELLQILAKGAPGARVTREAKAALVRLDP